MKWSLVITILIICFSSCAKEQPRGHWHCQSLYSADLKLTIDFEKDDSVVFCKNDRQGAVLAKALHRQNYIPGGGECGVLNLNYRLESDTLYLEQSDLGGKFIGTRCDINCCDPQRDFFLNDKVEIDLPYLRSSPLFEINPIDTRKHTLLIGIPKSEYEEHMFNGPRLYGNGQFMFLEDIATWLEVENAKLTKAKRRRAKIKLLVDKDLSLEFLEDVLEKLNELGHSNVYLAFRSNEFVILPLRIGFKVFNWENNKALKKADSYASFLRAL